MVSARRGFGCSRGRPALAAGPLNGGAQAAQDVVGPGLARVVEFGLQPILGGSAGGEQLLLRADVGLAFRRFGLRGSRRGHGCVFVALGGVCRGIVAGLAGGAVVAQRGAEVVGAHPPVEQAGSGFEDVLDRAAERVGVPADRGERRGLAGRVARPAVERAQDGGQLGSGEVGGGHGLVSIGERRNWCSPMPAIRVDAAPTSNSSVCNVIAF